MAVVGNAGWLKQRLLWRSLWLGLQLSLTRAAVNNSSDYYTVKSILVPRR